MIKLHELFAVLIVLTLGFPAPAEEDSANLIRSNAPAMLFTDGAPLEFSVGKSIPGLFYDVLNRHDKVVASGQVPESRSFKLAALPRGYYRIALRAPGESFHGFRSFSVIPDLAKRRGDSNSPYCMDIALNAIGSVSEYAPKDRKKAIEFFIGLTKLAGVKFARERVHHAGTETSPGVYDWNRYGYVTKQFSRAGIRLSATCHKFAPWTLASPNNKLPQDLMTAYRVGKEFAKTFGGQVDVWEFWNEPELPGFCNETPWELAAFSKAAYLGFKAGAPALPVTNGSFCHAPESNLFAWEALQNDLAEYFDIFNFHIYGPLNTYPGIIANWKKILGEHGVAGMPLWVTENGTSAEGVAAILPLSGRNRTQSPEQEMVWAEFIPKSQILLQSLGVARTFTFVLPRYHEQEGRKEWGMLRGDYTAKPAFPAFATLTDRLGGAKYLGEPDFGAGIRAFLFRQPDGSQTVAFWSESELDRLNNKPDGITPTAEFRKEFTLPARHPAVLTDLFGTPETVTPENDRLKLTATRYPAYLDGVTDIPVKTPPPDTGIAGSRKNGLDKSIVLRILPSAEFSVNTTRTTLLLSADAKERKLRIQAVNFSEEPKRGELTVEGATLAGLPAHLELAPFETREIELTLPADLPPSRHDLVFGGIFNGRPISRLVLPLLPLTSNAKPLTGSENPATWRKNSSGKMEISWDDKERAIRFDVTFPPDIDRWVYPELLVAGLLPAGANGLSFEIKTDQAESEKSKSLVMLVEGDAKETGKSISVPYTPSFGKWQKNFIDLPISAEKIKQIRIGMNPRKDRITFWIRNLSAVAP